MTFLLTLFGPIVKSLLELLVGKTVDGVKERNAVKAETKALEAKMRSIAEDAEAQRRIHEAMRLGHDVSSPAAWNAVTK